MFEVYFDPKQPTTERPYGAGPITVYDVHKENYKIWFLLYLNGKWQYVDSTDFKPRSE